MVVESFDYRLCENNDSDVGNAVVVTMMTKSDGDNDDINYREQITEQTMMI